MRDHKATRASLSCAAPDVIAAQRAACLIASVLQSASATRDAFDDDDAPEESRSHQKLFLYGPRPPPRPGQRVTYIIDGMWKLPSKGIM
jgi:hypothetical protein